MEATSKSFGICVLISASVLFSGCAKQGVNTTSSIECAAKALPKSFLVKWRDQVPAAFRAHQLREGSLITRFDGMEAKELEREILFKHTGEYEFAEHNFRVELAPDEFSGSGQPGLQSSALNPQSTPPTVWGPQDIQLAEAWTFLGKKGDGIIVAVVDSGVDIKHPLLQNQIWVNPAEAPGINGDTGNDGIDNDKDGFIDDYHGWNFASNDGNVSDDFGHGTHVSGIIAGQPDSTNGFTGMAPAAHIMPIKFLDGRGGTLADAVKGVDFAVTHGARVINASWGGSFCSDTLKQEIAKSLQAGIVFVAAAGNEAVDISQVNEWPAVYQLPGKITVGAYSQNQVLSTFSNYGMLVDLAAPGQGIISTIPPQTGQAEGQYAVMSGTSMAAPFVSGVAALLLSARPEASATQIADAINNSVISGRFGVRTGGKLNALNAAQYLFSH